MTTLFPDVRVKRIVEMRGADGGGAEMIPALPAYWVGLLYDTTALDAAWDLVKSWTSAERDGLRNGVPVQGLNLRFRDRTVRDIARDTLAISRAGLAARRRLDNASSDETRYIDVLDEVVRSGTIADRMLARFNGAWNGNIKEVYKDYEIIV
jgi:glutamate--cysteine ligase